MIFRKISLERTSNNLACALQFFLRLFCARFALLKTGLLNQNLTKKILKIESFLQKKQNFFCVFFSDPRLKLQILTLYPCPSSFESFLFKTLNSEEKPSVKNWLTGPVKNRSTGRSTDDDFEIYRSGRVEKILTGSISALKFSKLCSLAGRISSVFLTREVLKFSSFSNKVTITTAVILQCFLIASFQGVWNNNRQSLYRYDELFLQNMWIPS